jgi:hypothetical protein
VDGKIFNSKGVQVGDVTGGAIYGLKGHKLYESQRNQYLQAFRRAHGAFERFTWFADASRPFYR